MLDMKFVRENPEAVKENIKKKFQDAKLPLVDQVLALDEENRAAVTTPRSWSPSTASTWTPPAVCPATASIT